jgi:putative endopeptidase
MSFRPFAACLALSLLSVPLFAQTPGQAVHGIQTSDIDPSVKPCDDFYQYADGGWMKSAQIPAEYPAWVAFNEVADRNLALLKGVLEEAARNASAPKASILQKVGDFYAAGMDEARIEQQGLKPLASRFARIEGLKTATELAAELGRLHREGSGAGFGFSVGVDDKASHSYIAQFVQGGLGLPDRDYYIKEDEVSKNLRVKYQQHVAKMLTLLGDAPEQAKKSSETVLSIETRLAQASMTLVEQRDPNAVYHKKAWAQVATDVPGFDWQAYATSVGLPASEKEVLVRQPEFFKELGRMIKDVPLSDWRVYLRWHRIHDTAAQLSSVFVDENFAFYGQILNGTLELSPRWKRVQRAEDVALGEAVGQLFVEKTFSPAAKQRALELVKNLQAALRERIQMLDWMTEPTKRQALQKLDAFIVKIGYPDKWRDYSKLEVGRESYVLNDLAAARFEFQRNLDKLGRPVDRSEWQMTPQQVNAYYDPTTNEICFPAGILQPPFFDPEADDAVNYGAIGMVIGHEMTHGFDDQGSQYDFDGNLKNWWTEADTGAYESRQAIVVDQYDAYKPLPDQAINGKLTLGENIADLGGLKLAFAAFQMALQGKPRPAAIDGFAPEQRFFLGYAQAWRAVMRPEFLRRLLNTDPHSPPRYRVLGPLSNLPEFASSFGCTAGAPMVRPAAARPTIW